MPLFQHLSGYFRPWISTLFDGFLLASNHTHAYTYGGAYRSSSKINPDGLPSQKVIYQRKTFFHIF